MENVIFTQLSLHELRNIIREEMQNAVKQPSEQLSVSLNVDPYMNIKETANLLGLAVPSIYGLVHRREIPHIKRGKFLKFERNLIIAWLESARKKTKEEIKAEATAYMSGKMQVK